MKSKRTILFSDYQIRATDEADENTAVEHVLSTMGPIRREAGIASQIRTQMTYMGLWFWAGLAGILFVLLLLRRQAGIFMDSLNLAACTVLTIAGPLLISLSAPILSRSHTCGMWELEDSAVHNLPRLTALRLLICGLSALPVMAVLYVLSADASGIMAGLGALLIPFLVSCAAVFLILGRVRGNTGSLCCVGVCLVIAAFNGTLFTARNGIAPLLLDFLNSPAMFAAIAAAAILALIAGRRMIHNPAVPQ